MAETFLFNIAQIVLGKIGTLAYGEASLVSGVHHDLQRLERTLSNVRAVLLDAEEKQEHNHALRVWLGQLKDVFAKAEDVLDEFECEALRQQVVKTCGSTRRKVSHFFSSSNSLAFRIRMAHNIKEIREKLDEIAADKVNFHYLVESSVDRRIVHRREMTHSFVNASDVIGRDDDKENIIQHFLMHPGDSRTVSVIPIMGIGGLGKTTLAKLVFNDERVNEHFEVKGWVCVSDDFDVKQLMFKIVKSASHENIRSPDPMKSDLDPDHLQTRLRTSFNGRRFLLVLDDVWEEERSKWIELSDLLKGGASGSKILVTTRSSSVASMMGTAPTYMLAGLPHKDCLSLFVKWAFKEGQEKQYPDLVKIGNEIVKKCGGVPLAVRTLGSLLFSKTEQCDWIFVRDSETWKLEQGEDGILSALMLSYNQMPSYLKQCFVACSIFPKDYEFDNIELINFWMAHNLLQSPNENQDLEDIGMQYIIELCSRSFFQDFEDYGHFYIFKLHDLAHDLAVYVSNGECSTVQSHVQKMSSSSSGKVRHLSFLVSDLAEPFSKFEGLRTIYFPIRGVGPRSESFLHKFVSRFKCLRVLDLSDSTFKMLPRSIGKMKHLRYLDISRNGRIRRLPDTICRLQNLQFLSLRECVEIEELPSDMGNLISLRYLDITTKQHFLPEEEIESLCSLRHLYFSECDNLSYLGRVQQFTSLRTIGIDSCRNLKSLPIGVQHLTSLRSLLISNCENLHLSRGEGEDIQNTWPSLQTLALTGLPKLVELPTWLKGSAKTLKTIKIDDCPNFDALPAWLVALRSLQKLYINMCPKLLTLPRRMCSLTFLQVLEVVDCPELYRKYNPETGFYWPEIAHVPRVKILEACD